MLWVRLRTIGIVWTANASRSLTCLGLICIVCSGFKVYANALSRLAAWAARSMSLVVRIVMMSAFMTAIMD